MQRRQTEADEYIDQYPHLAKWLRTCGTCGATGHDPEMPKQIHREFSVAAKHLRAFFRPLVLNAYGHCHACANALGEGT